MAFNSQVDHLLLPLLSLPHVAENKIPQPMDVVGEYCLYDEFVS
jgi:hypothetical protein